MKRPFVLIALLLLGSLGHSQNDPSKRIQILIKERIPFFSIDERYNLIRDTIYHANAGFRLFSGYDEKTLNGEEYLIFSYPDFKGNQQDQVREPISMIQFMDSSLLDQLAFRYKDEQPILYEEILNTLITMVEDKIKENPVHRDIYGRNQLKLAYPKEKFEKLRLEGKAADVFSLKWKYSTKVAVGFMSIPFKLRPKQDTVNFNITTDVTLGAYIGVKKRISRMGHNFMILPVTLGLSYINVGNNKTSNVNTDNNSSVVPGWTWSTGIVFDLDGFNLGLVLGQDFASGVGDDWLYNRKFWYSFSIGYSFLSDRN